MRAWSEQQAQERLARKDAEDDEAAAYWAYLQRVSAHTRVALVVAIPPYQLSPRRECVARSEAMLTFSQTA